MEAILMRALNNEPLGSRTVKPRSLADAGARLFGSWRLALIAAGIDPQRYVRRKPTPDRNTEHRTSTRPIARRRGPGRFWSNVEVLRRIRGRLSEHKQMNATVVHDEDSRLYWAAKARYGSWRNAMLAAGLDPDEFRKGATR